MMLQPCTYSGVTMAIRLDNFEIFWEILRVDGSGYPQRVSLIGQIHVWCKIHNILQQKMCIEIIKNYTFDTVPIAGNRLYG